jgi:hypothetical protein
MFRFIFFVLLLSVKFCISKAAQTIILEDTSICPDPNSCEKVDSIYIPPRPEKCSNDLLFQFGEDSSAYLTQDGKINSLTNESECSLGFNRVKYFFKNLIIEVIKHKNSVYVKSVNKTSDLTNIESTINEFMKQKIHDFVQYILIFVVVVINVIIYYFKTCACEHLKR